MLATTHACTAKTHQQACCGCVPAVLSTACLAASVTHTLGFSKADLTCWNRLIHTLTHHIPTPRRLTKLKVAKTVLVDEAARARPGADALAAAFVYLQWVSTGAIACVEGGGHYRPNHHARLAQDIFRCARAQRGAAGCRLAAALAHAIASSALHLHRLLAVLRGTLRCMCTQVHSPRGIHTCTHPASPALLLPLCMTHANTATLLSPGAQVAGVDD